MGGDQSGFLRRVPPGDVKALPDTRPLHPSHSLLTAPHCAPGHQSQSRSPRPRPGRSPQPLLPPAERRNSRNLDSTATVQGRPCRRTFPHVPQLSSCLGPPVLPACSPPLLYSYPRGLPPPSWAANVRPTLKHTTLSRLSLSLLSCLSSPYASSKAPFHEGLPTPFSDQAHLCRFC